MNILNKRSLSSAAMICTVVFTVTVMSSNVLAGLSKEKQVVENYTNIAHAVFEDALITAKTLGSRLEALAASPSGQTLDEAKLAWKAARVPYQQSEVFRFGNANVDDWEGQLNAWPLDEGLIDYVDSSYEPEMGNIGATANIINSTALTFGGETVDVSVITSELLASLNELGGSEANVATGYHAIEFLLWGQDLNGTNNGAGNRPYSDFIVGKACTNGDCVRRVAYLKAASDLLISDLASMVAQWEPKAKNYRQELMALKATEVLGKIFYGMGSLSLGELAGERMKVALEANSPEDEHDCFSDNTHYSHYYDALGVKNIYLGEYLRVSGALVSGTSLSDLVKAKSAELDKKLRSDLADTDAKLQALVDIAEAKIDAMKFDQMIASGNKAGRKLVTDGIAALVAQTASIEKAAAALGIDNLNPDTADHTF